MKFSLKLLSPTWNGIFTVALCDFNCAMASMTWTQMGDLHLVLCLEPAIEFCANWLPEWHLTKHRYLWGHWCLTPGSPMEIDAFCVCLLMVNFLRVGETLWVHLAVPGPVEKIGPPWLDFAFCCFVVLEKCLARMMYQVVVGSAVRKSNEAYWSTSDTCEYNGRSSFVIWSLVYCCFAYIPICLGHIGLHPNKYHVNIERRRSIVMRNNIWEWCDLCIKAVCVIVFVYWKCFMDHVHFVIYLNKGFFYLLLPENWGNSSV